MQEHGSRIEWIDIAKALGIFLVIAGHTGVPIFLKSWIYAFHMPMFFIISGLWFRDLCGIERMKKTIKSYLKPYFLYSVIFLFLTFFVCRDTHQFLDNTMRIFMGGSFFILWFLFVLFWVENLYQALYTWLHSMNRVLCISFLLLNVGQFFYNAGVENFLFMESILEALFYFALGFRISKKFVMLESLFVRRYTLIGSFVVSFGISSLTQQYFHNYLDLAVGNSSLFLLGIIAALSGSYCILTISYWVLKIAPQFIVAMLKFVGQNTMIFFPLTGYIPYILGLAIEKYMGIEDFFLLGTILKIISILICFAISLAMKRK